jgi:hypothetical protein
MDIAGLRNSVGRATLVSQETMATTVLLRDGSRQELVVHELPDVEAVGGCQLVLEVGKRNLAVIPSRSANSFSCILTEVGWENVADLMEPFCEPGQAGAFQWLSDEGKIPLLLSVNGQW